MSHDQPDRFFIPGAQHVSARAGVSGTLGARASRTGRGARPERRPRQQGAASLRRLIAGIALAASTATLASAQVTTSQFPPRTVRDLIAICSAGNDDPMMTAAVNYCHGYTEGAVDVEQALQNRQTLRKLICLPATRPPRGAVLKSFIAWVNAEPSRIDMPALTGMFVYLLTTYPCGGRS